jgi:hypothetical protein
MAPINNFLNRSVGPDFFSIFQLRVDAQSRRGSSFLTKAKYSIQTYTRIFSELSTKTVQWYMYWLPGTLS